MPARIMNGRVIAQEVKTNIKRQVGELKKNRIEPNLATILVGENAASRTYLKNKHAACLDVGIKSRNMELQATISQRELESIILKLNEDETVTGILLQLPLPKSLDESSALSSIAPEKDVDGLTPYNLGLLLQKGARLAPCTPKGVMVMLRYYGVEIAGQHAVIINRSKLVGRPLSQLLLDQDATVTICHSKTRGLKDICRESDILITGIGRRSEFNVGSDMIRAGSVVVDVGISSVDGKLMGDVDFEAAVGVAGHISPVPGGVGPMTIAMLLHNTLLATCLQEGLEIDFDPDELRSPESL